MSEDYTVGDYKNVSYGKCSSNFKYLKFKHPAIFISLVNGEGVVVSDDFVDAIVKIDDLILVLLKGHKHDLNEYEVLWRCEDG